MEIVQSFDPRFILQNLPKSSKDSKISLINKKFNMLQIYNTLSRKKEDFKPINPPQVSFYQCGPTVYWTQHIGNMRAMVLADLVRRSLKYLDYDVKFARNYTDVGHMSSDEDEGEDKMEKAAKRDNLNPEQVADKYIAQFEADVRDLNCLEPDFKPRATEYIKPMQEMVQDLLDKGFAYATDLAIYFDVSKTKDYTKLSGQDLSKNISDAGKGDVSDSAKKSSVDFAVWFFKEGTHKNALQTWESHFKLSDGIEISKLGFPGWHLECSAMNKSIFGSTIDIHMGGIEHVPVHHTNEIAQSECANGVEFVKYWIHNEHLTVDGGKMSKSEGTAYSLAEIKEKGYDPLVLRYFFLQSHYRSKQNFTWEALEGAKAGLKKLRNKILDFYSAINVNSDAKSYYLGNISGTVDKDFKLKFQEAISDDFNISQALAVVWEVLKSSLIEADKDATIKDFDNVLGLFPTGLILGEVEISQEIIDLAEKRLEAKKSKDFKKSDQLRDEINKLGYIVEDTPGGYRLRRK